MEGTKGQDLNVTLLFKTASGRELQAPQAAIDAAIKLFDSLGVVNSPADYPPEKWPIPVEKDTSEPPPKKTKVDEGDPMDQETKEAVAALILDDAAMDGGWTGEG